MGEVSLLETEFLVPILKMFKDLFHNPITLVILILLFIAYIFRRYKVYLKKIDKYDLLDFFDIECFKDYLRNPFVKDVGKVFIAIIIISILIMIFNKFIFLRYGI